MITDPIDVGICRRMKELLEHNHGVETPHNTKEECDRADPDCEWIRSTIEWKEMNKKLFPKNACFQDEIIGNCRTKLGCAPAEEEISCLEFVKDACEVLDVPFPDDVFTTCGNFLACLNVFNPSRCIKSSGCG